MPVAQFFLAVLTALLSCGGTSAIVLYRLKRKDKVEQLLRTVERQSEGIACLVRSQVLIAEVLHAKGMINGESEKIRQQLQEYLVSCTQRGMA